MRAAVHGGFAGAERGEGAGRRLDLGGEATTGERAHGEEEESLISVNEAQARDAWPVYPSVTLRQLHSIVLRCSTSLAPCMIPNTLVAALADSAEAKTKERV